MEGVCNGAGQITGNLNTLIMLRVKNEITARTLTDQLPKARVYTKLAASQVAFLVDITQAFYGHVFVSTGIDVTLRQSGAETPAKVLAE